MMSKLLIERLFWFVQLDRSPGAGRRAGAPLGTGWEYSENPPSHPLGEKNSAIMLCNPLKSFNRSDV